MGYLHLLERYSSERSVINRAKARVKLPRLWTGIGLAAIGCVGLLWDLCFGVRGWLDPFPIGNVVFLIYWYFCIFRIHQWIADLEPSYPIGPLKVTALTILPNIVVFALGAVIPDKGNYGGPMILLMGAVFGSFIATIFAIFWQMRWTWCLTAFLKRHGSTKLANWLPGVGITIACALSLFCPPLAFLATFGIGAFFLCKLRGIDHRATEVSSDSIRSGSVSVEIQTQSRKMCEQCNETSIDNAKFCNSCGTSFMAQETKSTALACRTSLDLSSMPAQSFSKAFEPYAKNAYRVLGLYGAASQSQILEAVSSIKRANKIGKTKETIWDLSWLGAISRTNADIQNAERQLSDPEARLMERLFWFHRPPESGLKDLTLESINSTGQDWLQSGHAWAHHDVAVLWSIAASVLDPNFASEGLWSEVIDKWATVANSDDYWLLLFDLDEEGQFEPAASASEISDIQEKCLKKALYPIVIVAKNALAVNDVATVKRALRLLTNKRLPAESVVWFEQAIVEPLEVEFENLCEAFQHDCNEMVKREKNNTQADTVNNKRICDQLNARYHSEIKVTLERLTGIVGKDSDVARRGRESAALCLRSVALGYTWADDSAQSESILKESSELAHGTIAQSHIEASLASIQDQAQAAKIWKDLKPIKNAPTLWTNFWFGLLLYPNFLNKTLDPELNSYLATYYLTVFLIPIFPLARYRVISAEEGGYRFIGRARMGRFDHFHRLVAVIAFIWIFLVPKPQAPIVANTTGQNEQRVLAGSPRAYFESAKTALAAKNYRQAVSDLNKVIRLKPDVAAAYYWRGQAFENLGETKLALMDYSKVISLCPSDKQSYYKRGSIYYNQHSYKKAIDDYRWLSTNEPDPSAAYYDLGLCYLGQRNTDKAQQQFTAAINANNKYALAYKQRALTWITTKQYGKAVDDLSSTILYAPTDFHTYILRGMIYKKLGDMTAALSDCNKAIELSSNDAYLYSIRSGVLVELDELDKAKSDLDHSLSINSKYPYAYQNRGYIELCLNQNQSAMNDLTHWLNLTNWKETLAPYGPIWYMCACNKLGLKGEANHMAIEAAQKLNTREWPYPVIEYLSGTIRQDQLLTLATDQAKLTEANTYIGMNLVASGKKSEAIPYLTWVRDHGIKHFFEYRLANIEIKDISSIAGEIQQNN